MKDYPKRIKAQLRKLMGEAYERELARELAQLATKFAEWQAGRIDASELNELIHKHHNGPSREMFNYYNNVSPSTSVARAVVEGLFAEDDIPADVWPYIEDMVKIYRSYL
jgi:hypothetical protein